MVQMEKYCPKCHKIYNDMKAKFCTNCATELIAREKRKPIPSELRHQIFVRDGYRCRECGKSKNDGISLEIDHIFPLSKGGSTTPDNLWTLCRDCNQAKKADVWKDDEIEITKNELTNLKNQLHEAEKGLKTATNENQIRDYKFKIKKFKTEYIPQVNNKLENLIKGKEERDKKRKAQEIENKRREILFKDLYIELNNIVILELSNYFKLTKSSNEEILRLLVDKFSEKEIYNAIFDIKKDLKEKEIKKSFRELLFSTLSENDLKLINNELNLNKSKEDVIEYLIDNYDNINDINLLINELLEKKNKKIVLKNSLYENFSDVDLFLFYKYFNLEDKNDVISYLAENFSEEEIQEMRSNLLKNNKLISEFEKNKEKRYNRINNELSDIDILEIANTYGLTFSRSLILNFIIENFSDEEIAMKKYLDKVDSLIINENVFERNKVFSFEGEDLIIEAEHHEKMGDYDSALYCYKKAFKLTSKLWIKNRMLNVAKKTKKEDNKHTFENKLNSSKNDLHKLKKCKNCGVTLSKKLKKCPVCNEKL